MDLSCLSKSYLELFVTLLLKHILVKINSPNTTYARMTGYYTLLHYYFCHTHNITLWFLPFGIFKFCRYWSWTLMLIYVQFTWAIAVTHTSIILTLMPYRTFMGCTGTVTSCSLSITPCKRHILKKTGSILEICTNL